MKKLLAVILVLVLTMGLLSPAFASTKYDCPSLKELKINSTEWTDTDDDRVTTMAFMLLEYMIVSNDTAVISTIASSGSGRIAAYGSCIDIYYLRTDGKYFNIFIAPNLGEITDYGVGGFTGSSSYTYHYVNMSDVISRMLELLSN